MKKILVATTRWEYYVSNYAGLGVVTALVVWFGYLSFDNGGIRLTSIYLWLAVILALIIPFALISILSSMKSVEVMQRGIVIYYLFSKHKNAVEFSQVAEIKSSTKEKGKSNLKDSFSLLLTDKRIFEFTRSQFNNYDKLKNLCSSGVKNR